MLLAQHGATGHCIYYSMFKNITGGMQDFRSAPR